MPLVINRIIWPLLLQYLDRWMAAFDWGWCVTYVYDWFVAKQTAYTIASKPNPTSEFVKQTTAFLQTSGKLLDLHRTGGPVTTWKIQVSLVLQNLYRSSFFFNIRTSVEGLTTTIFLPDRRTGTIMVFIGPPLFSLVEDRGPVDFPMSVSCDRYKPTAKYDDIAISHRTPEKIWSDGKSWHQYNWVTNQYLVQLIAWRRIGEWQSYYRQRRGVKITRFLPTVIVM